MKRAKTIPDSISVLEEISRQIINGNAEIDAAQVVDLGSPLESDWYQVTFWIKSKKVTELIEKITKERKGGK